jgi:BirA family biotin operon repressor/biotin-[acetyl-CoA-carboxylase] ligase
MKLSNTQRKLLACLSDGKFHSGQELANRTHVSRTSVWNYLKVFEDLGFTLHAVKGKGTRLSQPLELLDKSCILLGLSPQAVSILSSLDVLDITESTNRYLVATSLQAGLSSGAVCTAEMQTAGRGRLGRTWVSPYGQNIYLSFLWRFNVGLASLSGLSLACGVAVCNTLEKLGVSGHELKWPNDILWQGKKLGGILVEIQGENQGEYKAVIGIGLNYQMNEQAAQSIDQAWVSLSQISEGGLPSRNKLVAELINQMLPLLDRYSETGLRPYLPQWNEYHAYKNKSVRILSGNSVRTGVAKGISDQGELQLLTPEGEIEKITSGEVSLRLAD